MKLHYMGAFNGDTESLPHGEHKPGAVKFREVESVKGMAILANVLALILSLVLVILMVLRYRAELVATFESGRFPWGMFAGCFVSILTLYPHELLHAVCFRADVYFYTNWKQGLLFVVGPEDMSKGRFVLMSLLPNLVFGVVPFILGMVLPHAAFLAALGALAVGMGAGDYYNVFNALTQMPKGARTYLYQFHSYWYLPQ